jgi:dephospho-CoA kinase
LTTPSVVEEIASSLGRDVLAPDGCLDRSRVSAKVFLEPTLRLKLESILHPRVRRQCLEIQALATAPNSKIRLFVADVPLFFETGFPLSVDAQLVVACAPQTQRKRLLNRSPDHSPHQIDQRLAAQLPILDKVTRASQVLWNGGTREAFQQQYSIFLSWLHEKLPLPAHEAKKP